MTVKKDGDFAITRDSLYGTLNEPTYAGATSFMRRTVPGGVEAPAVINLIERIRERLTESGDTPRPRMIQRIAVEVTRLLDLSDQVLAGLTEEEQLAARHDSALQTVAMASSDSTVVE